MMSEASKQELYRIVECVRIISESCAFTAKVIHHLKMKPNPSLYDIELLNKAMAEMDRLTSETSQLTTQMVEMTGGEEE